MTETDLEALKGIVAMAFDVLNMELDLGIIKISIWGVLLVCIIFSLVFGFISDYISD